MKGLNKKDDLLAETTKELNELEKVFKITKSFAGQFDSHIKVLTNIIDQLMGGEFFDIEDGPDSPTQIRQKRITFQSSNKQFDPRLTFQAPEFNQQIHKEKEEQANNSNNEKQGEITKQQSRPEINTIKEEVNEGEEYNGSLNTERLLSMQNNATESENRDKPNIFNNQLLPFDNIDIQGTFNKKDSIHNAFPEPEDMSIKTDNDRYKDLYKEQHKMFSKYLQSGEESSKTVKMLIEKMVETQRQEGNEYWEKKYVKLKDKHNRLKDEIKSLEKENMELKIKNAVVSNTNDETQKVNDKLRNSFLTLNHDKSGEFGNIDSYKRKIESQSNKINHLLSERDELNMVLQSANQKLFNLEQDLRNNREEFFELYRVVNGGVPRFDSPRNRQETDEDTDELTNLLNMAYESTENSKIHILSKEKDYDTESSKLINRLNVISDSVKEPNEVSLRHTEKNIGLLYTSYKNKESGIVSDKKTDQINKQVSYKGLASMEMFEQLNNANNINLSDNFTDKQHQSEPIDKEETDDLKKRLNDEYIREKARRYSQQQGISPKFKKQTEIDFESINDGEEVISPVHRQNIIRTFTDQDKRRPNRIKDSMENCIYDSNFEKKKKQSNEQRDTVPKIEAVRIKRSDDASISDGNVSPRSLNVFSKRSSSLDKHPYPVSNQSKNFNTFGNGPEFLAKNN